jgi:transposase InsO family protein
MDSEKEGKTTPEYVRNPSSDPYPDPSVGSRVVPAGLGGEAPPGGLAPAGESSPGFEEDPVEPNRRHLFAGSKKGQRYVRKAVDSLGHATYTSKERLLLLDTWKRSGLPIKDFAELVGIRPTTLHGWRDRFEEDGLLGLMDHPRGAPKGSRLSEATKRAVLMMKEKFPDWGSERISDMLLRDPALSASPSAVLHFMKEQGYESVPEPTKVHAPVERRFERASPNQLWQTDLFTFLLKRQNRRVYLVGFMDDHSRFLTGYGLHATASSALVLEVFRAAVTSYGVPKELLTDRGAQYATWRGKGLFTKELEKLGVKQILAAPRHPQTVGKMERFWGSLFRECIESAVFLDLDDARRRIGLFIDWFNFRRPHQGIGGLVPADRFFGAAEDVKKTLQARVAANALEIARHGIPKPPFYITGHSGSRSFSVHGEGEKLVLLTEGGIRQEIDLRSPVPSEVGGIPSEVIADVEKKYEAWRTSPSSPEDDKKAMPEPVCPTGHPAADAELGNEEPTPKQAGESLGITLPRYYALEVDAFGGFLRALEPKSQGYQRTPEREVERLEKENARLSREAERMKTLLRASQRMVGMLAAVPKVKTPAGPVGKDVKKGRKPKKAVIRVMRLKEHLESAPSVSVGTSPATPSSAPSGQALVSGGVHE